MKKAITYTHQPSLFDWLNSADKIRFETSTATKRVTETPLIKQYHEIKRNHPDAILLFRIGDFYETFAEDAQIASEILNITLTRRANGKAEYIYLAGFPHHALDSFLPKLCKAGKRVAICEQLEDPKFSKKLVKRGIATA